MPSKNRLAAANRVSALERWHPHDTTRLAEARRDLRAEQLADHVRRVADDLTDAQRNRLAGLLRGEVA